MSTCIKCRNVNTYEVKGIKLYKRCKVCDYKELAEVSEYRIMYEDFTQKGEMYKLSLKNSIDDVTVPTITKNDITYTIHIEQSSMKRKYISHKDNKVYENIE